jgi:hypothetical protein
MPKPEEWKNWRSGIKARLPNQKRETPDRRRRRGAEERGTENIIAGKAMADQGRTREWPGSAPRSPRAGSCARNALNHVIQCRGRNLTWQNRGLKKRVFVWFMVAITLLKSWTDNI